MNKHSFLYKFSDDSELKLTLLDKNTVKLENKGVSTVCKIANAENLQILERLIENPDLTFPYLYDLIMLSGIIAEAILSDDNFIKIVPIQDLKAIKEL